MNRSIFQIWKSNKLSKYTSNKQISKFTIIRFLEVGRYELHQDALVNNFFNGKFKNH